MLGRFGNVLYWTFSGLAALLAYGAAFNYFFADGEKDLAIIFSILSALAWLFGRACRYVLAGK